MYTLAGRVSNLRADDITTHSVRARWDAPPGGASSYRVYHNGTHRGNTQNKSFNLSGLNANSEHRFRVIASGFMGYSELHRETTFWTAPNPPAHVYYRDLRHNQVRFEWRTPTIGGASSYRLYLDGRFVTTVQNTSGVMRHTFTGLREQTRYTVSIIAIGGGEDRSIDVPFTFTTTAAPPQPPTGLSISNITHNAATLHWSRPSGQVTGYRIYRSNGTFLGSVSGATNTSFRITGLAASAQHSVFVVATGPGGRSNNSATFSFRTLPAPAGGGGNTVSCGAGGFNSQGQWVLGNSCSAGNNSGSDSGQQIRPQLPPDWPVNAILQSPHSHQMLWMANSSYGLGYNDQIAPSRMRITQNGWRYYGTERDAGTGFSRRIYYRLYADGTYDLTFSFRGTVNLVGWVNNVTQVVNNGNGQIQVAVPRVDAIIRRHGDGVRNVYFTGHSLGGYLS